MSGQFAEPCQANDFLYEHVRLLFTSFHHWLGAHPGNMHWQGETTAEKLYHAPFVILSHNVAPDPVFTYGNLAAQRLFEADWNSLTTLPSRYSAEPLARDARERLLQTVARQGYIDDYAGIRVSSSGRRFMIEQAVVWNLRDEHGQHCGPRLPCLTVGSICKYLLPNTMLINSANFRADLWSDRKDKTNHKPVRSSSDVQVFHPVHVFVADRLYHRAS